MTSQDDHFKPVATADGSLTLKNTDIGEDYHSSLGAKKESRTLYIERSGFTEQLTQNTAVLDVGLGLGYNALTTIEAWLDAENPANLDITSLEINPDLVKKLASGHASWMEDWSPLWLELCSSIEISSSQPYLEWPHPNGSKLNWQILIGDATELTLPETTYHYVWQDAFSPTKNPTMWSVTWFKKVRSKADDDCKLMTYSVSRVVKDNLVEAGWSFERIPACGHKRHWLCAQPAAKK